MPNDQLAENDSTPDANTSNQFSEPKPPNSQPVVAESVPTMAVVDSPKLDTSPAPTTIPENVIAKPSVSPGLLVLQWLVYAFWGWTALALVWLTTVSVSHFINNQSDEYGEVNSMVAYSLAAVIVLFTISMVCDYFYARRETQPKTGAATIIMIIHAVIFALCGIGALIAAVFSIVQMIIGDTYDGTSGAMTVLISSAIIAEMCK